MAALALLALLLGGFCGHFWQENAIVDAFLASDGLFLNLLMVSVGIGIGQQSGIWQKIRQYHVKALVIPLGVILGSLAGGLAACWATGYPLAEGTAIASCMGWYSLGGVTIGALSGSVYGSVAFLSNLLRELLSFFSIPLLIKFLNPAACIAAAGATSEDTTLPMMMKYTDEESVVLSVLNGAICSAFVPVLINACYSIWGA